MSDRIWYIDRSRNYCYPGLESGLRAIVGLYRKTNNAEIDINEVVETLVSCGVITSDAKNKYAHVTRFRDHGFLTQKNLPGDSTLDFIEGRIDMDAMIVDHFLKRPMFKDCDNPPIKPFVLICCFFSHLFQITKDDEEYYLTAEECKKYLYRCTSYEQMDEYLTKRIISARHSGVISGNSIDHNEAVNFAVWFNALKNSALFHSDNRKRKLVPNRFAVSFFDYIRINSSVMSPTPVCNDRGDSSEQYEYYCDRNKGINETIPVIVKPNVHFADEKDTIMFLKYVFGLSQNENTDYYGKYLRNPDQYFGIYQPFLCVPYLALRHIWMQNSFIGDACYELISTQHR